jgi:hypothetical protein
MEQLAGTKGSVLVRENRNRLILICAVALAFMFCYGAFAQEALPQQAPDNVAGNWVVSAKGQNGEMHTDHLTFEQDGAEIKGHFKGPYQSGSLNGTVNIHHIVFRTNTRHPLTFRGRINGDTIDGTTHIEGREGQFHAVRETP